MPMPPEPPEVAVKVEGVKPASTWIVPAPLVATCNAATAMLLFSDSCGPPERPFGIWLHCLNISYGGQQAP